MRLRINVLGTEYTVRRDTEECRKYGGDGLQDRFKKEIILMRNADLMDGCDDEEVRATYERQVIRHELIHAFMFESGMDKYGQDEDLVQMLAVLWPRINEAMEKMGAEGQ